MPLEPFELLKPSKNNLYYAIGNCLVGSFLIALSDKGLCALFLGNEDQVLYQKLQYSFPKKAWICKTQEYTHLIKLIGNFIDAPGANLEIDLDIKGTPFQQEVWKELRKISVGTTKTYTDIAINLGKPKAVRAVANACAANALAVIIPCHRVIRSDGNLSGYRWGKNFKQALLGQEVGILNSYKPGTEKYPNR